MNVLKNAIKMEEIVMRNNKVVFYVASTIIVYLGLVYRIYIDHGVLDFNVFNYKGVWVGIGILIIFLGLNYLTKIWDRIFKK